MKILLVSHNFLPQHRAGTEIYTRQLGVRLKGRGHDVHVFTTEKDISRRHLSVDERQHEGLSVYEVFNNLYYDSFRHTWEYAGVEQIFARYLDRLQPDIVHFQHLLYLSVGCVEEAARRGIPVLFTLHDYWLQCPRHGQRVHFDGSICHTIDFSRCGSCLTHFKYKQTRLERRVGKSISGLRSSLGLNLGRWARRTARRLFGEEGLPPDPVVGQREVAIPATGEESEQVFRAEPVEPPRPSALESAEELAVEPASSPVQQSQFPAPILDDPALLMAREAFQRSFELRERLRATVYRFISPSRFLLERFIEWGLPPERIELLRTGLDLEAIGAHQRSAHERLRVAFIGSLVPNKGPHVLLEAWGLLEPELRSQAELVIHGPVLHNPGYVENLEVIAARVGARVGQALKGDQVLQTLCATDLLVVPSLWYENAPLIILEALATRTPLLVSNLGGMAELVREGESGYHFRMGDRFHLAEMLKRFLLEPRALGELYRTRVDVPQLDQNIDAVERIYREALQASGEPGQPNGRVRAAE